MDEIDFEVRYKTGENNHPADALSRLLTGSPTVEDDKDEILSFLLEETNDDLHLETIDLDAIVDFIENGFDRDDQLLAIEERKDARIEHINME